MAQQPMGIGRLGDSSLIIKRKFRWTFRVDGICGNGSVDESYVKVASRPNVSFEETELNFLNGKTWIPGKATFDTITVTYYDVASTSNRYLWTWLASVYNFTDPVALQQGSNYGATGTLTMFDGCGTPLEVWTMLNMWPSAINFGDLDYGSSDDVNIELTLRYSGVKYESLCPEFTPSCACTPCGSGGSGGVAPGFQA